LEEKFREKIDRALGELEEDISEQMEAYSINVDGVTQHGGGFYMYATTATKINEVNERAAKMIDQVRLYMEQNNISINGKPFVVYNQRNQQSGTSIFSAAVPTSSLVVTPGGSPVLNGYLPPQRVVKTTLRGNYKNAPEAWEATYQYINKNGMNIAPEGQPFEVFITDPEEVQNPAKWVTEIYIPVENSSAKE
ncbi:MAG TPA: GyrI-like domain-containing protein, partial [Salinimicrobium sp.]|nr:GyrI-like domain-containing protein [Salinimicrobium sp.]